MALLLNYNDSQSHYSLQEDRVLTSNIIILYVTYDIPQIMSVLVQVLEKLDEKVEEESKGVHNVLGNVLSAPL